MVYFLYLPCQICGSERASPREGITHVMQTYQKGTVSLGRPPMTHNFGMVYKKINYRLNRSKIDNVMVSKES
jgi:hypothetical protein